MRIDGIDRRAAMLGILNEAGLRTLRRNGHAAVVKACAPDLPVDDVRFVDASQRQQLETASAAELAAMFAAPLPLRPVITGTRATAGRSATIDLRIQPDLAYLRGHFPALPVVPGATQLGWALEFSAEILGTPAILYAARSVKFERIIQPGRSLRLHLAAENGASTLRFEYASKMGRHSSGHIDTARGHV